MAGYFDVVAEVSNLFDANVQVKVTVVSHGGWKGTVDMTYECSAGGSNVALDKNSEDLYVDQGHDPVDYITIYSPPMGYTFMAFGQERDGTMSDSDTYPP